VEHLMMVGFKVYVADPVVAVVIVAGLHVPVIVGVFV